MKNTLQFLQNSLNNNDYSEFQVSFDSEIVLAKRWYNWLCTERIVITEEQHYIF